MPVDISRPVRELAVEHPATTRVLESFGIDYCCGGGQSLEAACKAANLSVSQVAQSVESAISGTAQPDTNWKTAPISALSRHIVNKHHEYVKSEVPRLERLIAKVVAAHGSRHPELAEIQEIFQGAGQELNHHMMKEERMLFPYIESLDAAREFGQSAPHSPFGTVRNPIQMMMMEHDAAGDDLRRIRDLSSGYTPPPDACPSYQTLYRALAEFEADLHQHVHLENNILFPRAIDVETELTRA